MNNIDRITFDPGVMGVRFRPQKGATGTARKAKGARTDP